ncbi:MAG: aminoacetone oxidase family FAD-binding enzyme [Vicinamibacterales bacterium]
MSASTDPTDSSNHPDRPSFDVAIIGAGAAGLATAIFTRRLNSHVRVALVDGARSPGAKILVSGGSRCNVTNVEVTEADFSGGRPAIVRRVLRALPVPQTLRFFQEIGVPLHEEPGGKLFPDSNRARDVLDGLMADARRAGVELRFGQRVTNICRVDSHFIVTTPGGDFTARAIVIATGGLSLPKTGSDGAGYEFARSFGHTIVPTTPALVPLVLDSQAGDVHRQLSGVALPVRLDVRVDDAIAARVAGSLLWTHFGVSGPAALDASRHWLRARRDGRGAGLTMSLAPAQRFEELDATFVEAGRTHPRAAVQRLLAKTVPASVASAILQVSGVPETRVLADWSRDERRLILHRMLEWPLHVLDSRGYNYAEVTAGGVALTEIDPATMQSRKCDGLYLIGEVLDVDGRIGGFNFQWAWSSARVAAAALASTLDAPE